MIPFYPYQPTFDHDEAYSFLFFFCYLFIYCYSSSTTPQNIKIKLLCKVEELQTQFCLSKIFGSLPWKLPQNGTPQKSTF